MPLQLSIKAKMSVNFILLGMTAPCVIAPIARHYFREEPQDVISAQLDDRTALIQEQQKRLDSSINAASLDTPRKLQLLLNTEREQQAFFDDGMVFINPAGRIMAAYPFGPDKIGTFKPQWREFFQKASASGIPFITSSRRSFFPGEPVIAFTAPISGIKGRPTANPGLERSGYGEMDNRADYHEHDQGA